jgi:hypothetical protein
VIGLGHATRQLRLPFLLPGPPADASGMMLP